MSKLSWASTLLAFFTSAERASEIEGDLIEEAQSLGYRWFVYHVGLTTLALNYRALRKAPLLTLILSAATLVTSSVLTTFLLLPFVFHFSDFSLLMTLLVVCLFRTIACFFVGVALVEYARVLGIMAVMSSALLMLVILLANVFLHQNWGAAGDLFLGTVLSGSDFLGDPRAMILYTLCSVVPILLGGISSHRNRQRVLTKHGLC